MLLGVMLLFVGAVLIVNGVWLIGQARVAELAPPGEPTPVPGGAIEGEGATDRRAAVAAAAIENHPTFIQNREVTVLNIFTGFVGVVVSTTLLVQGNAHADLASIRAGGFIFLFAFTYLWVAINGFLGAGGRAFWGGCLFFALPAAVAGYFTVRNAGGKTAPGLVRIQLLRLCGPL